MADSFLAVLTVNTECAAAVEIDGLSWTEVLAFGVLRR
jgi:hypothetical protein